jgi:mannose-6-phosphate isomerase-like protein (cupin superfamily)
MVSMDAARNTPITQGRLSALMKSHGSMELRWYAPKGTDRQVPHDKDEVYVVISGRGQFVCGTQRVAFGPGDALFVPAHAVHRFEDFTDDFATWVIFYGPLGGERP